MVQQATAPQRKISPAERAMLFAQQTRQNWHPLPAVAGAASGTVSIQLPKTRLLSRVRLLVECTLNAIHSSNSTYTKGTFAPYAFLRRVSMEINSGFQPLVLSGRDLYFYNLIRNRNTNMTPATSGRGKIVQPLVSSASPGTDNAVRFLVDLPVMLNDKDPIGLMLLQNEETVVTINVDFGTAADLAPTSSGYTFAVSAITVTPLVETFSIPQLPQAFPDISILKLVNSKQETVAGAGMHTVKLPVGLTYRKLLVYLEDSSGGEADTDLTGDFEILFNQADTPYRISPKILAAINEEQFGTALPQGLYAFDLSYAGMSGYAGSRDYIDTERLTEFWFRFTAAAAGTVTCIYETLSRLSGSN